MAFPGVLIPLKELRRFIFSLE